MSEFSDSKALLADGCAANFGERSSTKNRAAKHRARSNARVPARKAKAILQSNVPAIQAGMVVMNAEQYEHFERCMTTPTTTATGMVTAAAEILAFSKRIR